MKPIKMLGLAALAALMAMAFVGASSAMAESTGLCKEDAVLFSGEVCPEAQRIIHVHERNLPGNPGLLLSSVVNFLCEVVLFLGDVISATNLGNPLEISGHFSYSGCMTEGGTACTISEVSAHAILKVLKLGHELADVTYVLEINLHCGFFINCTYDGEGLTGHALGPLLSSETNGEVRIEEQVTHRVSGVCPETAKLDLLITPHLSSTDISLAEAMNEPFRSGPTYIAK